MRKVEKQLRQFEYERLKKEKVLILSARNSNVRTQTLRRMTDNYRKEVENFKIMFHL